MGFVHSTAAAVRRLARLADSIHEPKRRRLAPAVDRTPAGPKLVRGRGLARRRADPALGLVRWLVLLLLALGLVLLAVRLL